MLNNCWHSFINYVLPLHNQTKLNSLQHMSAYVLASSRDIMELYVQNVPPNLFPIIFQSVIHHALSVKNSQKKIQLSDSIATLLHNWPYESLVLRDILLSVDMPKVPRSECISFSVNLKQFFSCIEEIVKILLMAFHHQRSAMRMGKARKLCTLDISDIGIFLDYTTIQSRLGLLPAKNTVDNSKKMKINSCKLVCDLKFDGNDRYISHGAMKNESFLMQGFSKVFPVYNSLRMHSINGRLLIPILKCITKRNANLRCLDISFCEFGEKELQEIALKCCDKLEGLAITYNTSPSGGRTDISSNCVHNFLKCFKNIRYLDVSGCTPVQGDWSVLREISTGLAYLKMVGCRITSEVLNCIAIHHSKTLLHLDISENTIDVNGSTSLLNLISSLEKIQILEMERCGLGRFGISVLESLIRRVKENCISILVLQIFYNDFPLSFLKSGLLSIVDSLSLRLLCITVPSDLYLSDDYNVVSEEIKKLKNIFSHNINTKETSQLQIEWREAAEYSRWYYFT